MKKERSIVNTLKALLTSRKFWLAFIVAAVNVFLFAKHLITAEKLAESLALLFTAVIVCIGAEDAAEKYAGSGN